MRNPYKLRLTETAFGIAELTYRATADFPSDERFGLVSQMRRASVSIGSNIAEGCGRNSDRQLVNFLQYSSGSASELDFQARLAARLKMGRPEPLFELCEMVELERKMLARYARHLAAEK
ncbi:MAG: four helix bundle protein [Gemmatimonadetes bacterium]|nr:four helix bundle protein [Gemmatimonadota bacterium]